MEIVEIEDVITNGGNSTLGNEGSVPEGDW